MPHNHVEKARRDWVAAKRPAYGHPKDTSHGETYYAMHPKQSKVVRMACERILYWAWTLDGIAVRLNETGVPTPYGGARWSSGTVSTMLRKALYKGELYAHR